MTKRSLKGTKITTLSGLSRDSTASIWQEDATPSSAKDNPVALTLIQDLIAKGITQGVLDGLLEISDTTNDAIALDTSDAITNVSTTYTVNRVFYLVCSGNIFKVNTGSDVEVDTIRLEVSATEDGMYQTADIADGTTVAAFEGTSTGNGIVNVSNILWLGSTFSVDITNGELNIGADLIPLTDNTHDLGSPTKEFKDLYIDGTAYLDTISGGDATLTGTLNVDTIEDSASTGAPNFPFGLTVGTEGTWTPDLNPSSGAFGSITFSTRNAYYVKIGSMVTVTCEIETSSISTGTASGDVRISGLPFTSKSGYKASGKVSSTNSWSGEDPNGVEIVGSSTLVRIYYRTTADGVQNNQIQTTDLLTGGTGNYMAFTITYFV